MITGTITILIVLLLMSAVCTGGIILQFFLSKKENRVLGLILPCITFMYSLLCVLNVVIMDAMSSWEVFGVIVGRLVLTNISTVILLAIYLVCREKLKRKKQLDKMNIQDLD
ncbi:hypothetical protein MCG98_02300 [Ruminococcus sp. OA3]|uniref:hypothetical protein n=1 Tax=Ruminococcus sp. OA3 TaxID=2914164 RepID=UPI001F0555F3|nr:hypothetical protein [Ruminococcus sp. OA3]MCH1981409.1 hypothetical protein [Ruminococcus sp. OA3]